MRVYIDRETNMSVCNRQLFSCTRQTFVLILFVHLHLSTRLSACLSLSPPDHQRKFGEDYGSCQAGISNVLTEVSDSQ